ncbi:hypothetical protein CTRI78_v011594 [Colletotrichum trifolii]|uniref:Uncharacterized protein n=1 Tax=Colletotrichum trifolii TaxID=5466 RepID=A0A4R8QEW9_COLTR|nr:hypothetical protein CTRI78_v011594 [Colletotrichum trifolii]
MAILLLIIKTIRTITILNTYNLSIKINFVKIINNYKNYSYFHKSLKRLVLYKRYFTMFPSLLE